MDVALKGDIHVLGLFVTGTRVEGMGYCRAGFYGYDILENLGSPRGLRSADRILPEFQHFSVGDEVPISPAGGLVFYLLAAKS